jgi:Zinc dependent phospholipase C
MYVHRIVWNEVRMGRSFELKVLLLVLIFTLFPSRDAAAYSLLTHERLIDLTWKESIVPLLLSRYPNLTAAQLDEARAYAYGGCVIQDIGYYPYGDASFSNLTHYVRSGDFVVNLFRNAHNADELAFAVGALSHYIGDSVGHAVATNRAVPIEFPELEEKYGHSVNYAEGKHQHVQTEFAFDIDEIAHHRVAPLGFKRHIGLKVPVRQLALAYYQTYGLTEDFTKNGKSRFNVREYRFAVHTFIPRIAYAVTLLHRKNEPDDPDTPECTEIRKEIDAQSKEDNWDSYRRKAGFETYALAGLIYIVPKVGSLKLVSVKGPTEATEADYMHSVALSLTILRRVTAAFTPPADGKAGAYQIPPPAALLPMIAETSPDILLRSHDPRHQLPNRDLDTGHVVQPGGYPLTDSTYASLLHRIVQQPQKAIPPGIKGDIQAYYANPDAPIATKKDADKWRQVQTDLATLEKMPTSTEPEPYPTYGDEAEGSE